MLDIFFLLVFGVRLPYCVMLSSGLLDGLFGVKSIYLFHNLPLGPLPFLSFLSSSTFF